MNYKQYLQHELPVLLAAICCAVALVCSAYFVMKAIQADTSDLVQIYAGKAFINFIVAAIFGGLSQKLEERRKSWALRGRLLKIGAEINSFLKKNRENQEAVAEPKPRLNEPSSEVKAWLSEIVVVVEATSFEKLSL